METKNSENKLKELGVVNETNLYELFRDKTIAEVWPQPHKKSLTIFHTSDTVQQCLDILERKMILSAPVVEVKHTEQQTANNVLGIVDMLDFALYAVETFPKIEATTELNASQLSSVKASAEIFATTPVSVLLKNPQELSVVEESKRETSLLNERFSGYLLPSSPMMQLITVFLLGLHRVPILNKEDGDLIDIITQSDLLQLFGQCVSLLPKNRRTTSVKELSIVQKDVISVLETTAAIDVLKVMRGLKQPTAPTSTRVPSGVPMLSAVPVVDVNGKLVASFSASNLKGLTRDTFTDLLLPVVDFLNVSLNRNKGKVFPLVIQHMKSLSPVTVKATDSLEHVVNKLVATKVHRVWVVDENDILKGVISLNDLFFTILPTELAESCFLV